MNGLKHGLHSVLDSMLLEHPLPAAAGDFLRHVGTTEVVRGLLRQLFRGPPANDLLIDLEQGLEILGFPCNQFGSQEPGTEGEIATFCETNYGVGFPMFSKVEVNGAGADPLYQWLTGEDSKPDGAGDVAWNFAKFLIDKDGRVAARFAPPTEPCSAEVKQEIEAALG